jgi:hypothetical protein
VAARQKNDTIDVIGGIRPQAEVFFFEKKNQKTFANSNGGVGKCGAPRRRSFCGFVSKKMFFPAPAIGPLTWNLRFGSRV